MKWRLVWLRSEHPDAAVTTRIVAHDEQRRWALFEATVSIPDGGSAMGHGSEDAQGFGDYIEKAETKAIGRALSALGFGTQFAGDHDYGAAAGRVVDAPVQMRQSAPQRDSGASYGAPGPGSDIGATDRQRNLIQALAREQKISGKALDELSMERTGVPFAQITRQNASTLIEFMRTNQPQAMA